MKVFVFGTRGIPGIPGGVETHCEMIYPQMLLKNGFTDITVICRSPYMSEGNKSTYKGVKVKTLYAPKSKVFEAIVHSFLSAVYSIIKRPDIVHIHAIGPNLLTPILRLFGIKVIMTHHGPDYEREKWNRVEKVVLRFGEWLGVKCANKVIVISDQIAVNISTKYHRHDCVLIPNGVAAPLKCSSDDFLKKHNLEKGKYILAVGRFVPEKGFNYLINAFKKSGLSKDIKLVIAGDADHETPYSKLLKQLAREEQVILTGFIKGENLAQIYTNACLFIIPSFYEGLPIALLEAMNYDLDILASDILANKEVKLPQTFYFRAGDEEDLARQLASKVGCVLKREKYDMARYNWDEIALHTLHTYQSVSPKDRKIHLNELNPEPFVDPAVFNKVPHFKGGLLD
jgi:starch synthase